jgi:hypothetical protein
MHLRSVLFDDDCKRRTIDMMIEEYRELSKHPYCPSTVYGKHPQVQKDKKQRCSADLGSILSELNPKKDYMNVDFNMSCIETFLSWAKTSAPTFVLTWVMLVFLYVCPKLRDVVMEHTEPAIGSTFFETFEERFEAGLCGILVHRKERKEERSQLKVTAKTPFEIVLDQLLYYEFIRTSPVS